MATTRVYLKQLPAAENPYVGALDDLFGSGLKLDASILLNRLPGDAGSARGIYRLESFLSYSACVPIQNQRIVSLLRRTPIAR